MAKVGRKRMPKSLRRSVVVQTNFTPPEFQTLKLASRAALGRSLADFIRQIVLKEIEKGVNA